MTQLQGFQAGALTALALVAMYPEPLAAQLTLSQAIVDLPPGSPPRGDIDVANVGKERLYVVAEPAEIVDPGLPGEHRVASPDPQVTGLLVTPQRLILEPGEHRIVRVALVAPRPARDRIYRIAIRPVIGDVTAAATALKVLVGYDALVIARPATMTATVEGKRDADRITFYNNGNTNAELYDGKWCAAPASSQCTVLPGKRLYALSTWQMSVPQSGAVTYRVRVGRETMVRSF